MKLWNFFGLAALIDALFGRKSLSNINRLQNYASTRRYLNREADLNARYERLSSRIAELEGRLDMYDPDSELYEDFDERIDELREELYKLEDERYSLDDEYFDEREDW